MRKMLTFFIRRTLLAMCLLIGAAVPLWAATGYEVTGVTFSQTVTAEQFVAVAEDLTVSWTNPTGTTHTPMRYYLKFNTSNAQLSTTEFNDTLYDFMVDDPTDFKIIAKSFFDAYDSNMLRYLHIRTQYPDVLTGSAYSDDVVTGPIRIDNVAPTGTITLNPTGGNSRVVVVSNMYPSESIKYYWLSDSATFPGGNGIEYTPLTSSGTVEITEGTSYGNVNIYAWFQDQAGNRSTAATASAVYAYSAPTSIQHTSSSMNVDATLVFTVDRSTHYNWTITITPSTAGVAEIQGGETSTTLNDQHSVTVVGKAAGTFTVSAVPTANTSATPLTTGTITVVQTSLSKTFDLITTETTSTNTVGFVFENTGFTTAHDLGTAVGNCTQVSKWNAATQSYLSHRMQFPTLNNFALNVGEAYFVTVTDAHQFTLSGTLPTSHSQPLITTATTSTNAIGVPQSKSSITTAHDLGSDIGNCSQVSKWNAATQSYLSHRMQFATLNNFPVAWGEGYFITVTQDTNWLW